jgi:polar amino acid transport system ATP-binding protein
MISILGVSKFYGSLQVLKDVSFDIGAGEVVVVCGPSGSGKSTLLRCLNKLESVNAGKIIVDDIEVTSPRAPLNQLRAEVGVVFQSFNLYPHMTALRNVTLAPILVRKLSRRAAEDRARELLAKVGIEDKADHYPTQLSGGQQQRVAIARALAMRPKVMLFDEPTSALDPEMIQEVLDVITGLAKEGMTMLVVTHEMGFARRVAHRIVFMDEGSVVEESRSSQFFNQPSHERTRRFLGKILGHS